MERSVMDLTVEVNGLDRMLECIIKKFCDFNEFKEWVIKAGAREAHLSGDEVVVYWGDYKFTIEVPECWLGG